MKAAMGLSIALSVAGATVMGWNGTRAEMMRPAVQPKTSQEGEIKTSDTSVQEAIPAKVETFPLRDVRLLDGPFRDAQETDRAYLLRLDPDRFLHFLRKSVGLTPKAPPYGGWDRGGAGMIGHYLSACAQMAEATGDPVLKKRVVYIVSEMAECQKASGDGGLYASDYDRRYFAHLAEGKPDYPNVNAWYVQHKNLAGLRDAYLLCGDAKARDVLIRLCDRCIAVTNNLTPEQTQKMLNGEHGGPHEIFADVYAITGERKYLECAMRFRHEKFFAPLAKGDATVLNFVHANTQVPKFIGYERIAELGGGIEYHDAARNFWRDVVTERTWANGSNSQWEAFFPANQFEQKVNEICGPETCNAYNMLKLTRDLYTREPSASFVDYYERGLYNSILPSQDPGKGGFVYYTSMRPGHYRIYSRDEDAMWCCVGTGMENHGKYGEMIYAHDADSLYVNLFIASTLHWGAKGLDLRQETRFPEKPNTSLHLKLQQPQKLTLRVRWPEWVANGSLKIKINGAAQKIAGKPGSYVALSRVWKSGDQIDVALPMRLTTESLPHSRDWSAFLYGPVLLAAPLGTEGLTPADFHAGGDGDAQLARKILPLTKSPLLVSEKSNKAGRVKPLAGKPLTFQTQNLAKPDDLTLIPFYRLHEQRYAIYLRTVKPEEYATEKARLDIEEREADLLEQRTIDRVRVGEQQPEADHKLASEGSRSGNALYPFSHWRDATGWFSYDVKVSPGHPVALRCAYYGSDSGRTFDILVNGTKIATEQLTGKLPNQTLFVTYPVPEELTRGKTSVTVCLQAAPGSVAGGLFDLRVITQK